MPQCDPTFAISQVFWLVLTWLAVVMCLTQYAWPRLLRRQRKRHRELQKWIDGAVSRRAEIAAWQASYQQALDIAHAAGRTHVHEELAIFEKMSEKRRQDFLNQHHTQPVTIEQDVSDIKEALQKWKKACLKILPFS